MEGKLSGLKSKLAWFCQAQVEDTEFVHELTSFARQAERLLHGEYQPPSERDLDAGKQSLRTFFSDQKVVDFTVAHGIVCADLHKWWWPREQRTGEVRNLPTLRGTLRITNGVVAFIENSAGEVHLVHNENFKFDRAVNGVAKPKKPSPAKPAKPGSLTAEQWKALLE